MMNTRALAAQVLARNDYQAALSLIDSGIEKIRAFLNEYAQSENEAECFELGFLLRLRREVEDERPIGPIERLEQQLELAVALEEFEEAARIRDQLQRLRNATAVDRG
jgi:excinuclease UvrABC helicase subunit UvrB